MRRNKSFWLNTNGDALPWALIALAIAVLIVGPVMAHVTTGTRSSETVQKNVHAQYSSDAGAEYGLWTVKNNLGTFHALAVGDRATVAAPELVNAQGATVEIILVSRTSKTATPAPSATPGGATNTPVATPTSTCTPLPPTSTPASTATSSPRSVPATATPSPTATLTPAPTPTPQQLQWVLWANSTTASNSLVVGGSGHRVNGAVHSNNEFSVNGSGHYFSGQVEYVSSSSIVGSGHTFVPSTNNPRQVSVQPLPILWDISQFNNPSLAGSWAARAQAEGKYFVHSGNWGVSGSGTVIPEGLHYCTGRVNISGSGIVGRNVTIVADGTTIDISGSGHDYSAYVPGLSFFSTKSAGTNVISISGSGNTGGTSYAPNGKISLTGSGGTIIGAFIGNEIDINGSGATINLATVYLPAPATPTPTVTPVLSNTPVPTATSTATPVPTNSPTATPTPTDTDVPAPTTTGTSTPASTAVPTQEYIFDIRSTSNGTTTVVRVRQVGENGPFEILSWYVEAAQS